MFSFLGFLWLAERLLFFFRKHLITWLSLKFSILYLESVWQRWYWRGFLSGLLYTLLYSDWSGLSALRPLALWPTCFTSEKMCRNLRILVDVWCLKCKEVFRTFVRLNLSVLPNFFLKPTNHLNSCLHSSAPLYSPLLVFHWAVSVSSTTSVKVPSELRPPDTRSEWSGIKVMLWKTDVMWQDESWLLFLCADECKDPVKEEMNMLMLEIQSFPEAGNVVYVIRTRVTPTTGIKMCNLMALNHMKVHV